MHHAYLDRYAGGDSVFHRLDGRVKLLTAVVYTVLVLSLPKTTPAAVCWYAVAPFGILVFAGIPAGFVFRRIAVVSPFVLILALSCPLYDKTPQTIDLGTMSLPLTVGWMRCFTILIKFAATMLTLFALTSTTRFVDMLAGMQRMGLPNILVVQLSFVYRYLFVLVDRVHHILRARSARKLRSLGFRRELHIAAAMIGALFIDSIESAERVHIAMQARGFTGRFHSLRPLRITRPDGLFLLGFIVVCVVLHGVIRPYVL
jgi:cobalt/nickel transport system permease protein